MSERTALLHSIENRVENTVKNTWQDYTKFLNKQNVVGLAIGILIGTSFQNIVDSLVNDIFIPVLSLISTKILSETFIVLRHVNQTKIDYKTRVEAKADGAITLNYGNFIENIINFLMISVLLYFMVKVFTGIFRRI